VPLAEIDGFRARLDAAHRARNAEAIFQVGRDLHEWIVGHSGNRRLAEYLGALRSQIHTGFAMGTRLDGQMTRSYREYRALLGAMRRRDAVGAERAMRRHLESVRSRLLGG
jgi:DNA-binding FadR family transcriptional regulator